MPRIFAFLLATLLTAATTPPSQADELMARFSGEWVGTGQLLYGPRNTFFRCELKGDQSDAPSHLYLTGRCWMGKMSAPVSARLRYNAGARQYHGAFMDGAAGFGADITGTRSGGGLSLRLTRSDMQGRLTAEPVNRDQMKVMLYYNDPKSDRERPVAAMGFARPDANSLPNYMPDIVTGSITPQN